MFLKHISYKKHKDYENVISLLSGTFHEIGNKLKMVSPQKIYNLYSKKKELKDTEKEIGIF